MFELDFTIGLEGLGKFSNLSGWTNCGNLIYESPIKIKLEIEFRRVLEDFGKTSKYLASFWEFDRIVKLELNFQEFMKILGNIC